MVIILEKIETSEEILGSFDVEHVRLETLLFQTGYLIPAADNSALTQIKQKRYHEKYLQQKTFANPSTYDKIISFYCSISCSLNRI